MVNCGGKYNLKSFKTIIFLNTASAKIQTKSFKTLLIRPLKITTDKSTVDKKIKIRLP